MKAIRFEDLSQDQILIDLRPSDYFAIKHYSGSINVPFSGNLVSWVQSAVPIGSHLVLLSTTELAEHAAEILQIAGFKVESFISEEALELLSEPATLKTISVQEAYLQKKYIVDVRTLPEWNSGHIQEAHHIELSVFAQKMDQIPENQEIAVICGGGNRSSVAASLLQKCGHQHISNVRGGMAAWKQAKLPTEKKHSPGY